MVRNCPFKHGTQAPLRRSGNPSKHIAQALESGAGETACSILVAQAARGASPETDNELLVEVCWLMTYLTHAQPAYWARLSERGAVHVLLGLLESGFEALRTPVLRAIGNMVSASHHVGMPLLAQDQCFGSRTSPLRPGST